MARNYQSTFQVDIIINSMYVKCSSQFCVFFTFLGNLIILINFALIGNDLCHSIQVVQLVIT